MVFGMRISGAWGPPWLPRGTPQEIAGLFFQGLLVNKQLIRPYFRRRGGIGGIVGVPLDSRDDFL